MGILLIIANLYIDTTSEKYSVTMPLWSIRLIQAGNGIRKWCLWLTEGIRYRDDGGYTVTKFLDSEQFSIDYNRGKENIFMVIMILRIKLLFQ